MVGGVERRVDRKEASDASKLHGWSERLANSHDLPKGHRRLNHVNLQVSSSRLLDHRDKPNPSNEAIVLIDDDPVHTLPKSPSPPDAEICVGASSRGYRQF